MIEFIIPTYSGSNCIRTLLECLNQQTSKNWKATIVCDGQSAMTNQLVKDLLIPGKIDLISLPDGPHKDWGHTPREVGKNQSTGDFIVMTGDDNYYVPSFVQEVSEHTTNYDFIYCDMLHNQYDYRPFITQPTLNYIDIGCFAIRGNIAKKIPLNKTYSADGEFVQEYIKRYGTSRVKKINKILYVHN